MAALLGLVGSAIGMPGAFAGGLTAGVALVVAVAAGLTFAFSNGYRDTAEVVAERHGITVDDRRLARDLGVPVVPLVARRNEGVPELLKVVDAEI